MKVPMELISNITSKHDLAVEAAQLYKCALCNNPKQVRRRQAAWNRSEQRFDRAVAKLVDYVK